jgi:Na+-driven multidrug efflux pump
VPHQGVLVLARTFGKVGSYTLCGREAALLGPVAAAAHNLMFNLGVATTQVCESVAVATQTLLAREMGGLNAALSSGSDAQRAAALQVKRERSWHIIRRGCGLGGLVATTLSLGTLLWRNSVVAGLTNSEPIRAACLSIMPIVLFTQVAKGLAYPVNGIIMGGLDWGFSTAAMWAANAACVGIVLAAKSGRPLPPLLGGGSSGGQSLLALWIGLAAFMWVQVGASVVRFLSGASMWSFLRDQGDRTREAAASGGEVVEGERQ